MAKAPPNDRLLEAWAPSPDSGEAVGFIATTFTFNADFFEQDCLGAFLQMESDMDSEGLSYLIEREEKLSKVECAMVIADQRHCNSRQRNIRWDLLPFRTRTGIQHAKISLLVWTKSIRLIVGSANLTEEGYRRNQEVYAAFDISDNSVVPFVLIKQTLGFLQDMLNEGVTADAAVTGRGTRLINRVKEVLDQWQLTELNEARDACQAWPVFIKPGNPSAFAQMAERWQQLVRTLPDDLEVISPFFDREYSPVHPLAHLKQLVTPQGKITISTSGERDKGTNGKRRIHLPVYYQEILKNRLNVNYLSELVEEEKGPELRPLHMKALRLIKGNRTMVLMGSSNFTTAGLGTSSSYTNYEANVLFIASASGTGNASESLKNFLPKGAALKNGEYDLDQEAKHDESEETDFQPLPNFLLSAEADLVEGRTVIRIKLDPDRIQGSIKIALHEGETLFTISSDTVTAEMEYDWYDPSLSGTRIRSLPAGFEVSWSDGEKRSWLPLNVKNYDVLPPPDELKSLPFDVLLRVLTSAKPLQVILRRYIRKLKEEVKDESPIDPMGDPHKRVDTSGFLLQRTRRISYAFNAIREMLSRPVSSLQSLHWRLYGPVGLNALVDAILNEDEEAELKTPEERAFFLAELILELSTLQPSTAVNYLPSETVRTELQKFIDKQRPKLEKDLALQDSWIRPYVIKTLDRAIQSYL